MSSQFLASNSALGTPQRQVKIFFTWRERLEGVNVPFLGPRGIYAVAVSKEASISNLNDGSLDDAKSLILSSDLTLAFESLSSTLDEDEVFRACTQALFSLKEKLSPQTEIFTYLSDIESLRGQAFDKQSILVLSADTQTRERRWASTAIRVVEAHKLEALRFEFSMIPWFSSEIEVHQKTIEKFGALSQYDSSHEVVQKGLQEHTRKKKILLHVCCGPDAAGVTNQLQRDFDVTCFWYDPNIQPQAEYDKRLEAFKQVAELERVPYIVGEYDVARFFDLIQGLEHTPEQGAKCSICYDMRLMRAALEAKEKRFDFYATTLAISPHKVQEKLKTFGELNFRKVGVPYYHRNFMKDDGFKRSVEYTRDYGIYRQDYCGCLFSLFEGGPEARRQAEELGLTREVLKPGFQNPFLNAKEATS